MDTSAVPLFGPWSLLSGDAVNMLLSTAVCQCSALFNCISFSDFMFFFTICNLWTIKDVVWCRCSTEQSNYCCKTQVLAVSIKLCFLHSNVSFNDICEKLFNSLPLWMPNNSITKIQVIVLKIRTLILISCQEMGCNCVSYAPLMKKLFSNSSYCLDPDNCQSWELSEDFLNNTQQQLIKIKTICYHQIVFNRTLSQA